MSYILRALKKSSEERARFTTVEAKPEAAIAPLRPEDRWRLPPRWWIAGIVLTSLALIFVIATRTHRQEQKPDLFQSHTPISADTRESPGAPIHVDKTQETLAVPVKKLPSKQPVPENPASAIPAGTPPKAVPKLAAQPPASAQTSVVSVPAENAPGTVTNPSTAMPADLLNQVLATLISAHVYSSKPADRMVIIDGRAVREGDSLPSGMTIEQITPTGISVTYKGYRANKPVH